MICAILPTGEIIYMTYNYYLHFLYFVNSAVSADVLPLWLTMFKNVIFQLLLEWSRIKVIR